MSGAGLDTIDVGFDFRTDTPGYPRADPDVRSPTLRRYHQLLWSKPLPSGRMFTLASDVPGVYLHHRSELGAFRLASDAVVPSFRKERSLAAFHQANPEALEEFMHVGYTIGGMLVFPGHRVGSRMTINGARGCHPRIKDRFDLTLECIRRHYAGIASPLTNVLGRYADFFALFGDFAAYVDFFLLHDLVSGDGHVRMLAPFDDFASPPVPQSDHAYVEYRERALAFIRARNARIDGYRRMAWRAP
jgi:hypothetical protein